MIDAADLPDDQHLATTICVVGAGVAGTALALEFAGSGIDVLMLETRGIDDAARAVPRSWGLPLEGRRFAGRCVALSANELGPRRYLSDGGWPVSADALTPYFPRALALSESANSANTYPRDLAAARVPLIAGLSSTPFETPRLDRYNTDIDIGQQYRARLAAASNLCMIGSACVTELHLNEAGTAVESVVARTPSGRRLTVRAKTVVLAIGTLETARLLLAAREVHRDGIGNSYGNVGRYLVSPLRGTLGMLRLRQAPAAVWRRGRNAKFSRRPLMLASDIQQRLQLPTVALRLRTFELDDRIAAALSGLGRQAGHGFRIDWQAEQRPTSTSRVSISTDRDALGRPELLVDWRSSIADIEAVRRCLGLFDQALRETGSGSFDHATGAVSATLSTFDSPHFHPLGTARMGRDPRTSVVDCDGRVHGLVNLYVTGGAVFATSGLDDPMLNMTALALRLADHLKHREARQRVPDIRLARATPWARTG